MGYRDGLLFFVEYSGNIVNFVLYVRGVILVIDILCRGRFLKEDFCEKRKIM